MGDADGEQAGVGCGVWGVGMWRCGQGPLQGPLWSNPKSKGAAAAGLMNGGGGFGQCQSRLLDTPLTPAPHRMQDSEPGTSSMMASPAHGWRGGEGMGLALTAVDDLTGWLQHNKLVACPGADPAPR